MLAPPTAHIASLGTRSSDPFAAAQRYKEDQAKLAKEEAERKKRVEEQKARDAAIEEKRKELEKQRAAEEAEEQRKIAEKLEQLAVKEAKVTAATPKQFQSRCVMRDAGEGEH